MDGLRWLLFGFGLAVVAGVYLFTRYQRKKLQDSPQQDLFDSRNESVLSIPRTEPSLGEESMLDDVEPEDDEGPEHGPDELSAASEQKFVTLRIVARDSGAFPGDDLVLGLRGIGMRHGQFGIFHRHAGNDEDRVIFSAASLVEPGSFDLANIKDQEIPGISLFMVLPGPVDGAAGFDLMMTAARALSQSLNAELLDESGSTLSIQRERYLREEIIQYEHTIGVV